LKGIKITKQYLIAIRKKEIYKQRIGIKIGMFVFLLYPGIPAHISVSGA